MSCIGSGMVRAVVECLTALDHGPTGDRKRFGLPEPGGVHTHTDRCRLIYRLPISIASVTDVDVGIIGGYKREPTAGSICEVIDKYLKNLLALHRENMCPLDAVTYF